MAAAKKQKPKKKAVRNRLSRNQIVSAAIAYADKHDVERLSMRQLAGELDCGVMSLYNHVADKDDLIEGMVDAVAAEIELPTRVGAADTWAVDLRSCCISAYKAMLNHPWIPKYWGQGNGPAKKRYHETILRIMRQADFPEELSCRGFHGLTMHVVGFALQVLELRPKLGTKKQFREMGKRALDELAEDEFPYLREHVRFHLDGKDTRNDFKYMLELILDGLAIDKRSTEVA